MIDEFHKTVAIKNLEGPVAIEVQMPGNGSSKRRLEAWIGNFGGSNVYVFEGQVSLGDCEKEVSQGGLVDCLVSLTGSGPVNVPFDDDATHLTFFFEAKNEAGQTQSVSMKVLECAR